MQLHATRTTQSLSGEGGRDKSGPYTRAMNCEAKARHRPLFMEYMSLFHVSHPCDHPLLRSMPSLLKRQYIAQKYISYLAGIASNLLRECRDPIYRVRGVGVGLTTRKPPVFCPDMLTNFSAESFIASALHQLRDLSPSVGAAILLHSP